ncbi:MAG: hypothetical protein IKC01_00430 [Clostridia bacterium]|nr:hypothetical protein [Clostridia bacterium]
MKKSKKIIISTLIVLALTVIGGGVYVADVFLGFRAPEIKKISDSNITNTEDVFLTAHRGFSGIAPENTLAAFEKAAEYNFFAAECDVHLTKDSKLAVLHDASLWRTCGIDLYIEEINLEDAKIYFLEKSEERIPELKEVLEMVGGQVPLIIELKVEEGNHRALVDAVME